VRGREVEEGQQRVAILGQAFDRLGYFAPCFSAKAVTAASAVARSRASRDKLQMNLN